MQHVNRIAARLSRISVEKTWDVERAFAWPERLDPSRWCMSPELVSLHGTAIWDGLSDRQRRDLAFRETVNFFSLVLQGERALVQGLAQRLYSRGTDAEISEYLHHFIDEENKHMSMFGRFCYRYAGRVYPEKKIAFEREHAPGEQEVVFFCKVLVIEELGDFYNRHMMHDSRLEPIVRELHRVHHVDESRHLAFGRTHLRELLRRWSPQWSPDTRRGLRHWLGEYLRSSLADFYNPTMYADAGFADGFDVRREALAAPAAAARRRLVSARLVKVLSSVGLLEPEPAL